MFFRVRPWCLILFKLWAICERTVLFSCHFTLSTLQKVVEKLQEIFYDCWLLKRWKRMRKNQNKQTTFELHHKSALVCFMCGCCRSLAVVAKCLASLNDLNSRVNALEEKILDLKSLRSEKHDQETRRSKRGIDEANFDKAMIKLEKLEGR